MSVQWIASHREAWVVAIFDDAEIEALIDETIGKPGLGTQDSAGLIDHHGETEDLIEGRLDNEYHASGNW